MSRRGEVCFAYPDICQTRSAISCVEPELNHLCLASKQVLSPMIYSQCPAVALLGHRAAFIRRPLFLRCVGITPGFSSSKAV
eukprot:8994034-Pyramimonas_sp.AAC.1